MNFLAVFIPEKDKDEVDEESLHMYGANQAAAGIGVAVTVHFNVTISPALEMMGVND